MFDFKLTEKGDLAEEAIDQFPVQKITFSVSEHDVQRISFIVTPLVVKNAPQGEQEISFRFTNQNYADFTESSVQDEDELNQALLLALKTEANDTYDSDVGTGFYKLKHTMIKSDSDIVKLKDRASEIVRSMLPDATVEIVTKEYPDAGYFRYATCVVVIYDDDVKIAEIPI